MWAPAVECVSEDRVSHRREWLAPASIGVNAVGASDGAHIIPEQCKTGDIEATRPKDVPPLPLLHMQEAPTQGERRPGRNPQGSPEILLTVSQLQQQVCELQDVVRSLSTSQALSSRRGDEPSPRQDGPHMVVARTASEERLLQMYREHRQQTHEQQADAEFDGCASRSPSPLVNHPQAARSNAPQRAARGINEDQSPRRRPMQPLPCPEGMPVCRSSSSSQRARPQRPAASAETAHPSAPLSPWKALCQRFLPLRNGKWPSTPLSDRPGVLQKDIALQVRDIICGVFGSLELAAIQAALDLRLCAEEQVDDFILDTLGELAGTDQEASDLLVAAAPLSDLQASLPPVKFALPQFEDMLVDVFPVLLSRRIARHLFQFLDTEQIGLVELTHLNELDRICSCHGGSVSSRRSPSPVSGRPAGSSRSQLPRNSSGEIEDKYSQPRRPSGVAKAKNKGVSPERASGFAGAKPAWDASKTVSTAPLVNITANSGVQLEVEQHQTFISMLRPTATGYFDHAADAAPSSARRIEDRPERSSSRSGYRSPPGERGSRRPRSPTAPSRSSTSGVPAPAPRSVSPQHLVPVSREVSNGGVSKVRWSPPDLSKKDESKAIETERLDQLNQTALSSTSARRSPPPKGGAVAATSSLQNLPVHRDLTSEEAKRRASSLQSLLAFAAEVQARQTEAPSTGASSCHEDEPQREPPVTPPAPAKVPPLAMALRQEQLMSLKDHARSEENVDASKPSKSQQASPPTPSSATHQSDVQEQLPKTLARGGTFQAPFTYGNEVPTPPAQELLADPLGPTRVSSDSSLGNAQVLCGAIVASTVNAGHQVYSTPPVPVRASSATSPRVRVRPPESERQKKQPSADAVVRNPPVQAAQSSTQVRKSSPLWPAASHGHDLLQRTAKLGQPLGATYGQQRFTQANVATVASSNITMAPAASLPRMHSSGANFVGSRGRGSSFGPVVSRTDYVTSPRAPTAVIPQAQ